MTLFFLVFFTLYGLMHAYLFVKVRAAFHPPLPASVAIVAAMAVMVMMPYLVRLSERHALETTARALSHIGYFWMGGLLIFVFAAGLADLYRLVAAFAAGLVLLPKPSPVTGLMLPLAVSVAVSVYGYFEARNIRIERHVVGSAAIPAHIGKIRIVQISDVHLGLIIRHSRLRMMLEKVREAEPDVLVSTGDLVDGQINNMAGLAEMFQEIRPRYGKFAVTGNHEFYAGLAQAIDFTQKAGFHLLRGKSVQAADGLIVAGVDDPTVNRAGAARTADEKALFSGTGEGSFVLLLKHRPLVAPESLGRFDLQLSGHVHRGQIFPFSILTHLYYPVDAGFVALSDRSRLSVSRGTGTWGPPIRFLSPPEITVIDLVTGADG